MSGSDPNDPTGDVDKRQWQAEQLARDAEQDKRREKQAKARLRRARSAQRQLKRAKKQLEDCGEMTEWEAEFIASVDERLDKYDAAFADRSKGGPMDALSQKQKQVLAAMRRKIKDIQNPKTKTSVKAKPRFGAGFKTKQNFVPRVRHLEDEMGGDGDEAPQTPKKAPPTLRVIKGGKND